MPALPDRLFVACQRLLPARFLGSVVAGLASVRTPAIKDWQIRTLVRWYGIDVSEAELPVPGGYPTLNAFFTRGLKPGVRPVDPDPRAIASPADGRIEQLGTITAGQLIVAKGHRYSLATLLAAPAPIEAYEGGRFLTVYLAPHDYHRVHLPLGGRLLEAVHVPGRRLAVNPRTVAAQPGLFAANERVVCHAEHAGMPFAVVFVGALNVASVSLAVTGQVVGRKSGPTTAWSAAAGGQPIRDYRTGDLLGQFNLGSTVVVALSRALASEWEPQLAAGQLLRVGQRVGRIGGSP
jgi:phosphatidylserine decarboxylase